MRKRIGIERLVAAFLDSIFVGIIAFIPSTIFTVIVVGPENMVDFLLGTGGSTMGPDVDNPALIGATIIELIVGFFYFVWLPWKKNGQTPGKMVLKIKAINEVGENPSFKAHFIRAIQIWGNYFGIITLILFYISMTAFIASSIILGLLIGAVTFISAIMVLARTDEKGLHDLMADTSVVKVDENLNQDFIDKTTKMSDWATIVDGEDELDKMPQFEVKDNEEDEW